MKQKIDKDFVAEEFRFFFEFILELFESSFIEIHAQIISPNELERILIARK